MEELQYHFMDEVRDAEKIMEWGVSNCKIPLMTKASGRAKVDEVLQKQPQEKSTKTQPQKNQNQKQP